MGFLDNVFQELKQSISRFISGEGILKVRPPEEIDEITSEEFEGFPEFEQRVEAERVEEEIGDIEYEDEEKVIDEVEQYFRKIIKTGESRKGKGRDLYALTFEANTRDRSEELIEALEDWGGITINDIGYEYGEWQMMGNDYNYIYPDIEVGAE